MHYQSVNPCRVLSSLSSSVHLLFSCLLLFRLLLSLGLCFLFLFSVFFLCLAASVWCCGRVLWCVMLCCVVSCGAVWCVVCVRPNRPRVHVQNVSVYAGTTRTCVETYARSASIHGDVLNVHTGRRREGVVFSSVEQVSFGHFLTIVAGC